MEVAPLDDKPYIFRPYLLNDIPFIQSSWGNSYFSGVNGHGILLPEDFHSHHRPIRDKILSKSNIAIIVCCSKDDQGLIIGYSIVEKPHSPGLILHYIYVKQAFKKEGIAKHLIKMSLSERPVLYTHATTIVHKIMSKYKARGKAEVFDRFLFTPHLI